MGVGGIGNRTKNNQHVGSYSGLKESTSFDGCTTCHCRRKYCCYCLVHRVSGQNTTNWVRGHVGTARDGAFNTQQTTVLEQVYHTMYTILLYDRASEYHKTHEQTQPVLMLVSPPALFQLNINGTIRQPR